MAIKNMNFSSMEQIQAQYLQKKPVIKSTSANEVNSFQDIFSKHLIDNEKIKFSKHANERLASRNIELSQEQMNRLEDGITKAMNKGVKDSLMLVDNLALVVNIPNRTVITAVGKDDTIHNVFTNIDGAVIV